MEKVHLIFRNLRTMGAFMLTLFVFALCSYDAYAQTSVRGKITDTKGEPVTGAAVVVKNTKKYSDTAADSQC